jgi:hypothetical protein
MTDEQYKLLLEEIRRQSAELMPWIKVIVFILALSAVIGSVLAYLELRQLAVIARSLQ